MEDKFKNDVLQPIPHEKLLQLRDLYAKNWPNKSYIYYHIDMCYTWITKCSNNTNICIYSVEGNFEDGTAVIFSYEMADLLCVTYMTLDKSNSRLYNGLSKTKRINWDKKVQISVVHRDLLPLTCDITKDLSLHLDYFSITAVWWLPKMKALDFKIEIPKNTYLGPLSLEHSAKVYKLWPHSDHRPIEYIVHLIRNNNGIGLFDKNDNTLLAWILKNNFGSLGILQTDDNHKRKGYAKIVTKALCKQFAEDNVDALSFIVLGNKVSETLFKNLGFEVIDFIIWTGAIPR